MDKIVKDRLYVDVKSPASQPSNDAEPIVPTYAHEVTQVSEEICQFSVADAAEKQAAPPSDDDQLANSAASSDVKP